MSCLDKDKERPGLALWLHSRDGDYFTFNAFWVGADTKVPGTKYDAPPVIDGGTIVGKPDAWVKGTTEEIVVKRNGNNDIYLNLKVGGKTKSKVVVKDPPAVVWIRKPVVSDKLIKTASHGPDPGCSAGQVNDCIYPLHPGGSFVPNSRTMTEHSTSGPSAYSEVYYVDKPDQVKIGTIYRFNLKEAHEHLPKVLAACRNPKKK